MFFDGQLFAAIFKLALPVGVLSFIMVWWSLQDGRLSETENVRALRKEIDALGKQKKKEKKERKEAKKSGAKPPEKAANSNIIHDKWLKFGGGFYGIVAMYTYGIVEFNELRTFIASFGGFRAFLGSLNVGVIVNIFVEGLKNFITAITWPVFWMSEFGAERIWIWGGIAYGAYWLGMRTAQYVKKKSTLND